jgi:hypothetical protein
MSTYPNIRKLDYPSCIPAYGSIQTAADQCALGTELADEGLRRALDALEVAIGSEIKPDGFLVHGDRSDAALRRLERGVLRAWHRVKLARSHKNAGQP